MCWGLGHLFGGIERFMGSLKVVPEIFGEIAFRRG
jgi:hypothetical protein